MQAVNVGNPHMVKVNWSDAQKENQQDEEAVELSQMGIENKEGRHEEVVELHQIEAGQIKSQNERVFTQIHIKKKNKYCPSKGRAKNVFMIALLIFMLFLEILVVYGMGMQIGSLVLNKDFDNFMQTKHPVKTFIAEPALGDALLLLLGIILGGGYANCKGILYCIKSKYRT